MVTGSRATQRGRASSEEVDAVLDACRSLVAISVRSLAAVSAQVDVVQLRVLVVVASRGSVSLGEAADATGITLSKASRTCDRLVGMRLLARADDPSDRRSLKLTLTPAGRRVVRRVTRARRDAITPMVDAMSLVQRDVLVSTLRVFTAQAEPESRELWAMGWET
ncbi:MAG: MarR family winged helix-turn-helix transcriptional regulator [Jatrophihabitantaceae bacterium]